MVDPDKSLPAGTTRKLLRMPLIRLVAGVFLVFIPVAIGQTVILSLHVSRLWTSILVAGFTVPVAFGAYYVLVHSIERRGMSELSSSGAAGETAQGIAIGAVLFCAIILILALAGSYEAVGANGWSVLLRPFSLAVSSAVFEEILFRGVFFRLIERSLGSWLALGISAVMFGGLHLLNPNATVIGAVAIMVTAGNTLAGAFMLTRRLWLPMGIHFAWNFTQSGVFGSAVSGNQATPGVLRSVLTGPDWLTGGLFGVEASIVTMVVGAALGAFLVWRASRKGNVIQGPWSR